MVGLWHLSPAVARATRVTKVALLSLPPSSNSACRNRFTRSLLATRRASLAAAMAAAAVTGRDSRDQRDSHRRDGRDRRCFYLLP